MSIALTPTSSWLCKSQFLLRIAFVAIFPVVTFPASNYPYGNLSSCPNCNFKLPLHGHNFIVEFKVRLHDARHHQFLSSVLLNMLQQTLLPANRQKSCKRMQFQLMIMLDIASPNWGTDLLLHIAMTGKRMRVITS